MRLKIVFRFLALISVVISCSMLFPLFWALKDGTDDSNSFVLSMGVGFVMSGLLFYAGKGAKPQDMGSREAFAAVTLAWVFASLQGSLPYLFGGYITSFTDAYFEAMSGFTTTGATIIKDIAANPRGILMWRAQTQWLGGMGIVVLTIALLPMLGVTMTNLFKAESPGPVLEKISPRIQDMATMLWQVYMGLTVLGVLLLMCGGMNLYESISHTFTAVSTGGFSPKNGSVGEYNSAWFDWVLTFVMFLSGANFNLHFLFIMKKNLTPYRDPEFKFYTKITLLASFAIAAFIYFNGIYSTVPDALRFAAFQVVSLMTTTGFVTADYSLWPPFTQLLLVLLMILGGCAGSTSGAVKCVRIQVLLKQISAELKRCIHPHATVPVRIGSHSVNAEMVHSAVTFVALYMLIFFAASVGVAATGDDILTSITAVAATLGNVGPGLGNVGPVNNFADEHFAAKWIYSFCMLTGRLELYTVLVLFTKDAWKR